MGAIAQIICVLCQLKALSGRYWPVAQKDDTFCVVENHGKLLADIKFQQQQANLPAETPMANNERDVLQCNRNAAKNVRNVMYSTRNDQHSVRQTPPQSARDGPAHNAPTGEFREPQYSRDIQQHKRGSSNLNRTAFKSSANVQHRHERHSNVENADDHSSARGLSNLWLDFRINEMSGRKNDSAGGGLMEHPPESFSSSSYASSENAVVSQTSKSRPLRFCLSPEKKQAKYLGNKNSFMNTRTHNLKETRAVRPSDYRASKASEMDENFIGEKNTTDVYQSIKKNNQASGPHSRNAEFTPRLASTTPLFGTTTSQHGGDARQLAANAHQLNLDQVEALLAEILNKQANRKVKHSS
ncbi:hypothetical protein MTO96_046263 [Rhipicephalus appendiculatus]